MSLEYQKCRNLYPTCLLVCLAHCLVLFKPRSLHNFLTLLIIICRLFCPYKYAVETFQIRIFSITFFCYKSTYEVLQYRVREFQQIYQIFPQTETSIWVLAKCKTLQFNIGSSFPVIYYFQFPRHPVMIYRQVTSYRLATDPGASSFLAVLVCLGSV